MLITTGQPSLWTLYLYILIINNCFHRLSTFHHFSIPTAAGISSPERLATNLSTHDKLLRSLPRMCCHWLHPSMHPPVTETCSKCPSVCSVDFHCFLFLRCPFPVECWWTPAHQAQLRFSAISAWVPLGMLCVHSLG